MNIKHAIITSLLVSCLLSTIQTIQANFTQAIHLFNPTTQKHVYIFGDSHLYSKIITPEIIPLLQEQAIKQQDDIITWAHKKNALVLDEDINQVPAAIYYLDITRKIAEKIQGLPISPITNLVQKCKNNSITAHNIDHRFSKLAYNNYYNILTWTIPALWLLPNVIKALVSKNIHALFSRDTPRMVLSASLLVLPLIHYLYFWYKKNTILTAAEHHPAAHIIQEARDNYLDTACDIELKIQCPYLTTENITYLKTINDPSIHLFQEAVKSSAQLQSLYLPDIELLTHLLHPEAPETSFVCVGFIHGENIAKILQQQGYTHVHEENRDKNYDLPRTLFCFGKKLKQKNMVKFIDVDMFMQEDTQK